MHETTRPAVFALLLSGLFGGCTFGLDGDWDFSLDSDPNDCSEFLSADPFEPGQGGAADFSALEPCFLCEPRDSMRVGLETSVDARIAPLDAELPEGASLSFASDDAGVLEVVDSRFIDDAPRCEGDASATVRAVAPGDAVVQLVDGDGTVIDSYPIAVREVASIDLLLEAGGHPSSDVPLSQQLVLLQATARSDDGLGVFTDGAMQWTVDDPAILDFSDDGQGELVPDARGSLVLLSLRSEGSTAVRVRIDDLESTISVTVTAPAPDAPTGD